MVGDPKLPHRRQRLIDVGAETIETDSFGEARFKHDFHRLRPDGSEENFDSVPTQFFDCPLERMETAPP